MKQYIITVAAILASSGYAAAQSDTYFGPTTSMVLQPGAQMAFYGNIINDARATSTTLTGGGATGLNHNGGGTVYLVRQPTATGSSEVLDGPNAPTPTDNYNAGGASIRIHKFVTQNDVGVAAPSGTLVNSASGSGQVNFRQEVIVSDSLLMNKGIVWTPRDKWNHAFLHLESPDVGITNLAPLNTQFTTPTSNLHVDGYVAVTGSGDFTFPVGDGVYSRYCGIVGATQGTYRAAYFHVDPKSLTDGSGISGSPTQGPSSVVDTSLAGVGNSEFWDIDGSGDTKIQLSALNSVAGYSEWQLDPGVGGAGSVPDSIVIAGLDEWEDLGTDAPIPSTAYGTDGYITTALLTNSDDGNALTGSGNPIVAYTWAIRRNDGVPSGLQLDHFNVARNNCKATLNWTIDRSDDAAYIQIERTEDFAYWKTLASMPVAQDGQSQTFNWTDEDAPIGATCFYRLRFRDLDDDLRYSETKSVTVTCSTEVSWELYPNPTNDILNIVGETEETEVVINLLDVIGRVLETTTVEAQNKTVFAQIELSNLPEGAYSIQIVGSSGSPLKTQMIIKN